MITCYENQRFFRKLLQNRQNFKGNHNEIFRQNWFVFIWCVHGAISCLRCVCVCVCVCVWKVWWKEVDPGRLEFNYRVIFFSENLHFKDRFFHIIGMQPGHALSILHEKLSIYFS